LLYFDEIGATNTAIGSEFERTHEFSMDIHLDIFFDLIWHYSTRKKKEKFRQIPFF